MTDSQPPAPDAFPEPNDTPNFAFERVAGGQGMLMLMIHGMLSSRRQWVRNKEALATVVQPVLIDLWGHGDSPTPEDMQHFTVDGLVAAIDRIRVQHGAEKIILCTQSFGAGLGFHYCLRHPERVIAHVFTNSMSAISRPADFDATRDREKRIELIHRHGSEGLA
ncbi:MAG: alpha/beta fold hydrolase, partial [Burkholderiaceae bacterium]